VLERQLSKLVRQALRRAGTERTLVWGAIGIAAYVLRRELRVGDETRTIKVKRGQGLSIGVAGEDR
jgi:hypothetical protein